MSMHTALSFGWYLFAALFLTLLVGCVVTEIRDRR